MFILFDTIKSAKFMKPTIVKLVFLVGIICFFGISQSNAQEYVPFTPRLTGGNMEVRGDIIFVGNNILNRASESNPSQANDPYNGTQNNNSLWMEYIDIDTDPTTFSSSSAELNVADPDCSLVRYAGLYWAGTYPNERSTDGGAQFNGTPRIEEWNEIKFRVPGGTYVDLIADNNPDPAGQEDDIIMNGYQPLNPTVFAKDGPVICYKNITDLVRSNPNPYGEYTAANVRATRGRRNGSSSAGWVMVIIYENPNESGKFISTFDGYAGLSGAVGNVDVDIDGFRTLPAPFPVRARVGVGALEGDRGIRNDRFFIRADLNSGSTFTNLTTGLNPANNFFNSTITLNGAEVSTRTPFGTNTLGTDLDLFNLNNPSETVLPNDESGATLRFTSNGDGYGPFLATFSVEIIEPNIVLEKRVEDIAGNDITGAGVNLGQTLDYVLSFRNLGNDNAAGYTIRDVLPVNTAFTSVDISSAPGVTHTVNAATNEITFNIPDDLVIMGRPTYTIRMRVRVAENCFDFVDACTDVVQNLAYSTYQGEINSAVITDDPSVSDFDNCGFVTPGATNFLLDDLSSCNFSRTTQLCGDNVILDSGDGFDNYVWYLDVNEDGLIDSGDVNITGQDGNPDNDPSTIVVTEAGVYIVDKQIADPCKGFMEIITVERFGTTQTNPIIDFFNDSNSDANSTNDIQGEIVVDCNDGTTQFPKIALCGINDSQLLQVNIFDAQSLTWEILDEASCTAQPENCLNRNLTCTWNQVGTGSDFMADTAGKYRLSIRYQNGCISRFYFDVFQNNLDIQYTSRNVVCETEGNITITNLGSNYGYQLVNAANNTIVVPFSATNGPSFDFSTNGAYRVEVVQLNPSTGNPIPGACTFTTPDIGILNRALQVDVITTDANCNSLGSVQINANNVFPNYSYELRLNDGTAAPSSPAYIGHPGGTLVDSETAQPNNTHTFNNVNPDDYFIVTRTDDGCVDVQSITINRIPDPVLSAITLADIGCSAGSIELTRTGGQGNPDFLFAIWSKDGTLIHSPGGTPTEQQIIDNIDPNDFQVETTFTFGWRDTDDDGNDEYFPNENGVYQFIVLDANNCYGISSPVTINDNGVLVIDSVDEVEPSCSGDSDGELTINISNGVGPYQYSIDNGTTYQPTSNFVGLSAGAYEIRVLDSSGCDITLPYSLSEPFPLSASAGVSRDATCNPMGGEVRITNVVGGSGTYEYSFDGGSTWVTTPSSLLPPGDYTVLVRDDSCSFPMNVSVEDLPEPPNVSLTPEVGYNCDGSGTITASPSITGYDYRYELDGVPNTPDPTSNVFNDVSPGTYTVTTYYTSQTPPTPSLLLSEDFGVGNGTIPSPDTIGYAYEDQTTSTAGGGDTNRNINDFQYSVTNRIVAPFGAWVNPNNHTNPADPNGRFLVINVGTPSPGQIIYTKPINDVIPNRPLTINLYIFNLLNGLIGNTQLNPDLTIEIRTMGGVVIQSIRTGQIPKNTGPDDWELFTTDFDPGANTNLEFVIRSEISGNSGNDLALDDIEIFQVPEVCELFVETPVTVEAGRVFSSSFQSATNVSCNGLSDGTITFSIENFDATAGFEYSEDNQSTWIPSTSSSVTTNPVFGAGSQTVFIRKADEITCTTSVTRTITEPSAVVVTSSITTALTCNNDASITANASGGTPTFVYQLEDNSGVIIGLFDFTTNGNNRVFSGLSDGTYVVRARDSNTCEEAATPLTIAPLDPVAFNITETLCYTGGNSASIQVDVTDGNGGYQFRVNAGPWLTPTPSSATTYTFNGLSSGIYDIDVRDQSGCPVTLATQTVTIEAQLTVSATVPNISACDTDAPITITANGGDGNYVYSIVSSGNTPTDASFNTTNPITGFTAGNYDVYVRDDNGDTVSGFCEASFAITVTQDPPLNFTPTPTDVRCFGGSDGAITIVVNSGGQAPFSYSIDGGTTYLTGTNFLNLSAATYAVRVRDANLCESTIQNIDVDEPIELVAEAVQTLEYTCAQLGQISVGSVTATTGGSGDYQYSINGSTWTTSTTGGHLFTNLDDGSYSIRVRDANATGCFITIGDVTIDPLPMAPTVDYIVDYNCDGTGNVTIMPNDSSYIYILDGISQGPGVGAASFNTIAVGSYTLRVTYSTDCHVDTTVIVSDGNAFEASVATFENLDCNADASGSITIDASNYGAGGFEYSVNGGTFQGPFTTPQQITGLNAQTHNIVVRDVNSPTVCTVPLNQILTEPAALNASGNVTTEITCNSGATITASATGGTPTYEYQLEDDLGNVIAGYDFITNGNNTIFSNITVAGDYIIRAQDSNNCSDFSSAVTVVDPNTIVFDVTPATCYTGNNDGTIVVNVTDGNGGYQFRINAGPWRTPTPATAITYTFQNLANGIYDIEVRDQFGCPVASNTQTVTLNPNLSASIDVVDISSCADGSVTVNAIGGDGDYSFAFMPTGFIPGFADFGASNTFTVTTGNDGDYDVYVRDNFAVAPDACNYMETVTVDPAVTLAYTATPTDPECYDGTGSIAVNITSGDSPYTIQIIDLDNAGASDQTNTNVVSTIQSYFNLAAGDYTIIVTDANGCDITETPVTITNPDELTADIDPILPPGCDPDPNLYGFEFDNYPLTLGALEFSSNGGSTWQAGDTFVGVTYASGTEVEPSIRVVGTNCQTDLPRYTIPYPLDDLDITIAAIIIDCNDLQVTVQGTAGVSPYEYTYSEDPVNFTPGSATWTAATPGSHVFTGLIPGRTYVFYVRDSSGPPGCVRQSSVNVNDVAPPPIQIDGVVTPTCDGLTNGQITYTVTENTPGELGGTFDWELFRVGSPAHTSVTTGTIAAFTSGDSFVAPTPASLGAGDYFVEIRGAAPNNCVIGSENIEVEALDPITFTPNVLTHITCANPGLIEIQNPQGGGGIYTYTLSSSNFVSDIVSTNNPIAVPISNLVDLTATPFNVLVEIADQYNCPVATLPSHTVSMDISQRPTIDSVITSNCTTPFGITINTSGGTSPYLYSIDGGTSYLNNAGIFSNVAVGTYAISIIDANGCTAVDTAEIYPTLQASAVQTKLLDCTASPNAEITISASDGSGSYDYQITGPVNQPRTALPSPANSTVWNLATTAGSYLVQVYDNNRPSCPARSFTIEVPAAIVPLVDMFSTTPITCVGDDDGTITISAIDNATGPYIFEITSLDGTPQNISPTSSANTTATFTGLAPTTTAAGYIVTITGDSSTNNCSTNSTSITIAEPLIISVVMDPTVEFACAVGNNDNNASISVQSVSGGSNTFIRYQFINDLNPGTPVQDGSNDTYVETDRTGGNYTINVYDDNGCIGTTTASIAPFDELQPATITVDQAISCTNGGEDITINAFGSITDSGTPAGLTNYEFRELPSGTFNPSNQFTNLISGTHTFEVRNVNTNCVVMVQHTVGEPNNFEITSTVVDVICDGTDGSVSFTINDPITPYAGGFDYQVFEQITNTSQTAVLNHPNPGPTALVNLTSGDYYVIITQNGNPLCSNPESFSIAGPNGPITVNTQVSPVTCVTDPTFNDGVIEIIDTQGGWGGYEYFVAPASDPAPINSTPFSTNPRFTGLFGAPMPTGTDYQVWVRDSSGCMQRMTDVNLAQPDPITADLQINQPNCTDFSGEIQLTNVLGGQQSNYTYQLQRNGSPFGPAQTTSIFSGLGAGLYTVEISDQFSCIGISSAVTLYDVIAPRADIVKTIDCNSGGEITITQTGGSGAFDYEVRYPGTVASNPADDTNNTGIFTGLTTIGDYIFIVTDTATGHVCSTTVSQRLEDRVLPNISIDDFSNVTCNGTDDGTITVNANPDNGIGPYTFTIISGAASSIASPILPISNTDATAVFTGLEGSTAGITYTVRVTSPNGCIRDVTQTITEPNVISNFTVIPVQFGCAVGNDSNTASLSAGLSTLSGGSNNFVRFRFVNMTTATTVQDGPNPVYVETNYAGGTYEITVFDENGCESPVETEIINPFVQISDPLISDLVGVTCNPGDDAQIQVGVTLNPITATPNLEYVVTGINVVYTQTVTSTNNTEAFSGLAAGNYSVAITNLETGCVLQTVHTVEEPIEMDVLATKLTDEECLNNGVDDGSFGITISDYVGTFAYQVFDAGNNLIAGQAGTGNTTTIVPPITNLPGGSYYVRITQTEAPFCVENSNVITVIAPQSPITSVITEQLSVSCSNDQGRLLVNPDGGQGPYTIVLDNTITGQVYTQNNVAAFIFSNLSAGVFDIIITDALGCAFTDTITLIRPDNIVATLAASTLVCYGDNDASITAFVGGRNVSPIYQYQLNVYSDMIGVTPLQTSVKQALVNFDGLGVGIYSITVTDDIGCSSETNRISIVDPTQVNAQLVTSNPLSCATGAELELRANGGTGPYRYSEDGINYLPMNEINGPNTHEFTGLSAGTYRYYVQDSFNCTSVLSNEIIEDPISPLMLEVDSSAAFINCTGESTGIVFADADGGLGNYRFALYTDVSLSVSSRIDGPKALGEFRGLAAGIYFVEVISDDCITAPERVEIIEPTPLSYTESIIDVTCAGENNGEITVTLSGGAGGYQYAISPNLNQFFNNNTFADLTPGEYTIIAQDQNGCFEYLTYTVTEPAMLDVSVTTTPEICVDSQDGTITLEITGGTAPYSTALNANEDVDFVQNRTDFFDMASGNYLIFVRDANGCDTNVVVDIDRGVNLNATIETIYECSGASPSNYVNITLEDDSVIGDVLYALDSVDSANFQLNPDFRNSTPGNHSITIAHANGCMQTIDFVIEAFDPLLLSLEQRNLNEITAIAEGGREEYTYYFDGIDNGNSSTFYINRTDTYEVRVVDQNGCEVIANIFMEFIDIELPNFFTPDGDGMNDLWIPRNMEQFPEILIKIFDRYGRVVSNQSADSDGWDGLYSGKDLPTGDYWYVIKLNGERDEREFVGHFTLYR
ncbi:T9SS type B sorting domain-containing protein [Maribacter sp. ACAM166]|uniref:T9SS type B sorting domain-containing protein n=1 Tax=Maribacter sp. ACAM166 TaxID=2508996 RepID=UPI001485A35E|nr:T9SS type B sorting domain-containing protein [Maribacter sp. ACAM166]